MRKVLLLAVAAFSGAVFASVDIAEYDTVIHPGPADGSGIWNAKAKWFMYAPAFAFKTVSGAVRYRFTVTDGAGTVRTFDADRPTEPLARIWSQMSTGDVRVLCEGQAADGKAVGMAGERTFWKAAGFREGAYPKAARSYRETAIRTFEYVRGMKETAYLLEHGRPDASYELNTYVSKMMSALISGMLRYAQLVPEKESEALAIAKAAADHLIAKSEPADAPLAFCPPTYDGRGEKDNGYVAEKFQGQIMMVYPAYVASALTALYEKTGDVRYLRHAEGIAATYMRLQGEDGTWFVRIYAKDGRNYSPNRLVPIGNVIPMMETLYRVTDKKAYRDCADRAFASVKGRLEDWNWEGQFEDIDSTAKYVNLTKHDACSTAIYLGQRFPDDPRAKAQMRELIRFAEDQFVCWEQPFGGRTEEGGKSWNSYKDWCVPCALEQYNCYVPIDASAAKLIRTYLALYKAEGRRMDLAKARALGDTATRMQCPDGRLPTWWWPDRARRVYADWINCMLATAEALVQLSEFDSVPSFDMEGGT